MEEEEYKSQPIGQMAKEDRPREKAMERGLDALTNAELMALIFSTGIKGKSVIDMCREILKTYDGSLLAITNLPIKALCQQFKGIGVAKATTLLAGLTLGKRAAEEKHRLLANTAITDSEKAYNMIKDKFVGLQHEEFWILLTNRAGKVIQKVLISRGGTAATTVDVKLILKAAINHLASSIVLCHNHPSGTLRPSVEDDRLTRKIVEAAKLVDVNVVDHIIYADNPNDQYYSYADNGRI